MGTGRGAAGAAGMRSLIGIVAAVGFVLGGLRSAAAAPVHPIPQLHHHRHHARWRRHHRFHRFTGFHRSTERVVFHLHHSRRPHRFIARLHTGAYTRLQQARWHYLQGERLAFRGDCGEAIVQWQETVRLKPESDTTWRLIRRALSHQDAALHTPRTAVQVVAEVPSASSANPQDSPDAIPPMTGTPDSGARSIPPTQPSVQMLSEQQADAYNPLAAAPVQNTPSQPIDPAPQPVAARPSGFPVSMPPGQPAYSGAPILPLVSTPQPWTSGDATASGPTVPYTGTYGAADYQPAPSQEAPDVRGVDINAVAAQQAMMKRAASYGRGELPGQ